MKNPKHLNESVRDPGVDFHFFGVPEPPGGWARSSPPADEARANFARATRTSLEDLEALERRVIIDPLITKLWGSLIPYLL